MIKSISCGSEAQSVFDPAVWFKSSASDENGTGCVTVNLGRVDDGYVGLRDSKQPGGPVFAFTAQAWASFVQGVRVDEYRCS